MEFLKYPIIAFSESGFNLAACTEEEFTEVGHDDNLELWKNIKILDSDGNLFNANRVYIRYPRNPIAKFFFRVMNHAFYVGIDLSKAQKIDIESAKRIVRKEFGSYVNEDRINQISTISELVEVCQ